MDYAESTIQAAANKFPLESAKMAVEANHLLSDYIIFQHKLRVFHWNVTGPDFFDLHQQFETLYRLMDEQADELAERLKFLGVNPLNNWDKYRSSSVVSDAQEFLAPHHMTKETISDIQKITARMEGLIEISGIKVDGVTTHIILEHMRKLQKQEWLLRSFFERG